LRIKRRQRTEVRTYASISQPPEEPVRPLVRSWAATMASDRTRLALLWFARSKRVELVRGVKFVREFDDLVDDGHKAVEQRVDFGQRSWGCLSSKATEGRTRGRMV
jgi:hypothetical protein